MGLAQWRQGRRRSFRDRPTRPSDARETSAVCSAHRRIALADQKLFRPCHDGFERWSRRGFAASRQSEQSRFQDRQGKLAACPRHDHRQCNLRRRRLRVALHDCSTRSQTVGEKLAPEISKTSAYSHRLRLSTLNPQLSTLRWLRSFPIARPKRKSWAVALPKKSSPVPFWLSPATSAQARLNSSKVSSPAWEAARRLPAQPSQLCMNISVAVCPSIISISSGWKIGN